MKSHEEIASVQIGIRTLAGTEWEIYDLVERVQLPGSNTVEWVLIKGLCNGTADWSKAFRTRREALAALYE